jgi:hypothetical protein
VSFRDLFAAVAGTAQSMPRWVLPFYWVSASCVLLFAGPIWLVTAFCMSMRPVYESRRQGAGAPRLRGRSVK